MEIINASDDAFKYTRPLQKPMAKLLYHSTAAGSGHKYLVNIAGSITMNNVRFVVSERNNVLAKPMLLSLKLPRRNADSMSLFSYDRLVLKKMPENKPVRNMNMNIAPIFFICMSPFSS